MAMRAQNKRVPCMWDNHNYQLEDCSPKADPMRFSSSEQDRNNYKITLCKTTQNLIYESTYESYKLHVQNQETKK
jgi:hypothetical protein